MDRTGRDKKILELLSQGLNDYEVAMEMAFSRSYITKEVIRLMDTHGAVNRAQLVGHAYRVGLLRP